jgi:hypothetical protein
VGFESMTEKESMVMGHPCGDYLWINTEIEET